MKRVFLLLLSSLILFCCIAPVFSSAVVVDPGFVVNSPLSESYFDSISSSFDTGSFYVAYDSSHCIWMGAKVTGSLTSSTVSLIYSVSDFIPTVKVHLVGSVGTSYQIQYSTINLISGYVNNFTYNGKLASESTNQYRTFVGSDWLDKTSFGWAIHGSVESSGRLLESAFDFVSFSRPLIADQVVNSYIPEPHADLSHFYLADSLYLYSVFIDYSALYNIASTSVSALTSSREFLMFVPELKKLNSTTIQASFHNAAPVDLNVIVNKYRLVSGEFISSSVNPVPVASNDDERVYISFTISSDEYHSVWWDGFINLDGLEGFSRMAIRWSDTIDYSSDFLAVENLLNTIVTSFATSNSSLSTISSTLDSISLVLNNQFSWFKNSYYSTITGKWDLTNTKLDSIISILQGSENQTTLPHRDDVQEGVSGYIEQESGIMNQFDSAGSDVDSIFSDIESRFNDLSSSFSGVSSLFQLFVLENNLVLPLFLFSLAFGLIMLIIGRKAS